MKINGTNSSFTNYIKNNSLTITVQVVGFIVIVLNLWLSSKLAPLAKNIDSLTGKVDAVEKKVDNQSTLIEHVDVIQQQVSDIQTNIGDIKGQQTRMDEKIDKILFTNK